MKYLDNNSLGDDESSPEIIKQAKRELDKSVKHTELITKSYSHMIIGKLPPKEEIATIKNSSSVKKGFLGELFKKLIK